MKPVFVHGVVNNCQFRKKSGSCFRLKGNEAHISNLCWNQLSQRPCSFSTLLVISSTSTSYVGSQQKKSPHPIACAMFKSHRARPEKSTIDTLRADFWARYRQSRWQSYFCMARFPKGAELTDIRPFHWSLREITTHPGHRAKQNELHQL